MFIFDSDEDLRKYIPNVFQSVKGETPLFEKLTPFLNTTEYWLTSHIAAETELKDHLDEAKAFAVYSALERAIPFLDIVLTPNGYGIVSNSNIAPASKERVDRLLSSVRNCANENLEKLLLELRSDKNWRSTRYADSFAVSIFNIPSEICTPLDTSPNWDNFIRLRNKAVEMEDSLANYYFSPELMYELRCVSLCGSDRIAYHAVLTPLKTQIIAALQGNPICVPAMRELVDYIRKRPEEFPTWHNSETAKLWTPPKFENEKSSHGYFF